MPCGKLSCREASHAQERRMTYIIAHRGASYEAPENTLAAFRLAWDEGADGIEGDFMLTADGQIVCFHDVDTQRVAGTARIISESTFAELASLDVGSWKGARWRGERIPLLAEVLAVIPAGKKLVVELKDGPEIVAPLAAALARAAIATQDILIISLVDETLAECARQLPAFKRHWLSDYQRDEQGRWRPTADEAFATIKRVDVNGFGSMALPEHFNAEFVRGLRAAGIDEFHVWTVDDPTVATFYQSLGAWGITTNRPRFIRQSFSA
jgi:glycerophosphoryl diester phosphodiesterase